MDSSFMKVLGCSFIDKKILILLNHHLKTLPSLLFSEFPKLVLVRVNLNLNNRKRFKKNPGKDLL